MAMQMQGAGKSPLSLAFPKPGKVDFLKARAYPCRGKNLRSGAVFALNLDSSQKIQSTSQAISISLLVLGAWAADPASAEAATSQDIVDAVSKVQQFYGQVTGTIEASYSSAKAFFDQFVTVVKPAVDVATPYLQKGTDAALKAASPFASGIVSQAEKALQSAGVDTDSVVQAAKTAVTVAGEAAEQTTKVIEVAKPVASTTLESFLASDPLILVGGAGGLILLYAFAPSISSALTYAVRGYKGNLTAAQALDLLSNKDFTLIDVRTDKEKSKSGIVSLPRNANNKLVSIAVEEFAGKVRGQLRDPRKAEAEVTAIKISFLKRLNKGSNIIILDSNGGIAKIVARCLAALGFRNTWVIIDGFDGGKGWIQSKLGTEPYNLSFTEIFSPSRIIPAASSTRARFSSSPEVMDVAATPRIGRLLPGASDD